jgi:hypothetical protein
MTKKYLLAGNWNFAVAAVCALALQVPRHDLVSGR